MNGAKSLGQGQPPVQRIAADQSASIHQITLAWLLGKGPMVFPIPGASRKRTIEDSVRAADLTLSDDQNRQLDDAWT